MSTVEESVYPTLRRPAACELLVDPLSRSLSIEAEELRASMLALEAVYEALDQGLPAIRARGLDPDPDLVADVDEIPY